MLQIVHPDGFHVPVERMKKCQEPSGDRLSASRVEEYKAVFEAELASPRARAA
jgi:hypothetical protein